MLCDVSGSAGYAMFLFALPRLTFICFILLRRN
jgi:hypothetical protein